MPTVQTVTLSTPFQRELEFLGCWSLISECAQQADVAKCGAIYEIFLKENILNSVYAYLAWLDRRRSLLGMGTKELPPIKKDKIDQLTLVLQEMKKEIGGVVKSFLAQDLTSPGKFLEIQGAVTEAVLKVNEKYINSDKICGRQNVIRDHLKMGTVILLCASLIPILVLYLFPKLRNKIFKTATQSGMIEHQENLRVFSAQCKKEQAHLSHPSGFPSTPTSR